MTSGGLPAGDHGPHILVDDVDAPELSAHDRHHLQRSLRRRPGDAVTVTDGRGSWRPCRLTAEGLEIDGERVDVPRPWPALTIGVALTKGAKPELAVQKLTELGLHRIVVFEAGRSVARWADDRLPRVHERLARIMREALMQSRGVWLPELRIGGDFASVAELPDAVRADRGGVRLGPAHTAVLVGPEGGWTDEERLTLPEAVSLGPTVLRAETAAIAAGVLMQAQHAAPAR